MYYGDSIDTAQCVLLTNNCNFLKLRLNWNFLSIYCYNNLQNALVVIKHCALNVPAYLPGLCWNKMKVILNQCLTQYEACLWLALNKLREWEIQRKKKERGCLCVCVFERERECVCVCVNVLLWECERERERGIQTVWQQMTNNSWSVTLEN